MQEIPQSQFSRDTWHFPLVTVLFTELGEPKCACLSTGTGLAWVGMRKHTLQTGTSSFLGGEWTFWGQTKRVETVVYLG